MEGTKLASAFADSIWCARISLLGSRGGELRVAFGSPHVGFIW